MEKFCRAGQNIDDNMAHAHCVLVPKAKITQTRCVILVDFYCNNGCENSHQCDVLRTLPVLFVFEVVRPVYP